LEYEPATQTAAQRLSSIAVNALGQPTARRPGKSLSGLATSRQSGFADRESLREVFKYPV